MKRLGHDYENLPRASHSRPPPRFPWGVLLLFAAHAVGVFVSLLFPDLRDASTLSSNLALRRGEVWRFFTGLLVPLDPVPSILVAAGLVLIGFGWDFERRNGFRKLLLVYFASGLAAGIAWSMCSLVWDWNQTIRSPFAVTSLAAARLYQGWRTPPLRFGPFQMPAWVPAVVVVAFWWLTHDGQAVEFSAIVLSALFSLLWTHLSTPSGTSRATLPPKSPRTTTSAHIVKEKMTSNPIPPNRMPSSDSSDSPKGGPGADLKTTNPALTTSDAAFKAKVDALLAKINESGYESLTEDEIAVLLEASERYRRRGGEQMNDKE